MQIILHNSQQVHRVGDESWLKQIALSGHNSNLAGIFPCVIITIEIGDRNIMVKADELKAAIEALEKVAAS